MPVVLHISPFPDFDNPTSGGLIRIAEIRRAYQRNGYEVIPCHIVTRDRDLVHPLDQKLPWIDRIRRKHLGPPRHLGQIRLRWATQRSHAMARRIAKGLDRHIDVIHLEHPWLIELARQLRTYPQASHAALVYSAHNLEHRLHEQLWMREGRNHKAVHRLTAEVIAAEEECIEAADICWAVSPEDQEWLQRQGGKNVLLVPNGCRKLDNKVPQASVPAQPYVVFVGGDYPPNIDGFLHWIGSSAACLPSGTTIALAGKAGDVLAAKPELRRAIHEGKVINLGLQPVECLDQLLLHAYAILLPISSGGGTNLKTAEALCSRRPIVATDMSFRGFEQWLDTEGIHVANTPEQFMSDTINILTSSFANECTRAHLDQLQWDGILDKALKVVSSWQHQCNAHDKVGT